MSISFKQAGLFPFGFGTSALLRGSTESRPTNVSRQDFTGRATLCGAASTLSEEGGDLSLAQNHFAAFTGSFHRYRFAHLRDLHPGFVHDLVHHFVVVIGIVMEQQEPFCVGVGRE